METQEWGRLVLAAFPSEISLRLVWIKDALLLYQSSVRFKCKCGALASPFPVPGSGVGRHRVGRNETYRRVQGTLGMWWGDQGKDPHRSLQRSPPHCLCSSAENKAQRCQVTGRMHTFSRRGGPALRSMDTRACGGTQGPSAPGS